MDLDAMHMQPQASTHMHRIEEEAKDYLRVKCYGCGESGHIRRHCPKQSKKPVMGPPAVTQSTYSVDQQLASIVVTQAAAE